MIFTLCKLLRDGKNKYCDFWLSKHVNQIWRAFGSPNPVRLFWGDFAMDDDEKPITLSDWEINFLKEELRMDFFVEGNYFTLNILKETGQRSFIPGISLPVLCTYRKPLKREKPRNIFSNRYVTFLSVF